jgi:hypothetical protein
MAYKENLRYKKSYISYPVEDTQKKLGLWADVVW